MDEINKTQHGQTDTRVVENVSVVTIDECIIYHIDALLERLILFDAISFEKARTYRNNCSDDVDEIRRFLKKQAFELNSVSIDTEYIGVVVESTLMGKLNLRYNEDLRQSMYLFNLFNNCINNYVKLLIEVYFIDKYSAITLKKVLYKTVYGNAVLLMNDFSSTGKFDTKEVYSLITSVCLVLAEKRGTNGIYSYHKINETEIPLLDKYLYELHFCFGLKVGQISKLLDIPIKVISNSIKENKERFNKTVL